jgi:hypothetical protein
VWGGPLDGLDGCSMLSFRRCMKSCVLMPIVALPTLGFVRNG